jgi:hypothetical protein
MAIGAWRRDWLWSLPIIATTVVFHAFGLRLLNQSASALLKVRPKTFHLEFLSVIALGGTAFGCVVLHGCEAFMWAFAYRMLGAMSAGENAMLYSLDAMTTYGQSGINLQAQWQLMGSLEALNGWILFGLTTAFLFNIIQAIWVAHSSSRL